MSPAEAAPTGLVWTRNNLPIKDGAHDLDCGGVLVFGEQCRYQHVCIHNRVVFHLLLLSALAAEISALISSRDSSGRAAACLRIA